MLISQKNNAVRFSQNCETIVPLHAKFVQGQSRTYPKNPLGLYSMILAAWSKKFFRLTLVKHQNLFGINPLKILKYRLQIIFRKGS